MTSHGTSPISEGMESCSHHPAPPVPVMIDGIACYAPEIAYEEDGYPTEGFALTDQLARSSFWVRSRNRLFLSLFDKHLRSRENPKVLEIGCGTGDFIGDLSRVRRYDITGSEIYLAGLRYARMRRPDLKFIQMDAQRIPFEEEFDAVAAFDVIEHIDDDAITLVNIRKALKPGGVALISVPQYRFMWSDLDELVHHKRRYEKAELLAKLLGAGFTVSFCTSFVCTLFPLMLCRRLFGRVGRRAQPPGSELGALERQVSFRPVVNAIGNVLMKIDEMLIGWGVPLPFGGTLVVVATAGSETCPAAHTLDLSGSH